MISVERTILSQYSHSPTLVQLVKDIDACIDPTTDFNTFFSFVFNVDTAQGFGLDIWGRIVGVGRQINVPALTPNPGAFAFTPGVYTMPDAQYRKVILMKALANITATNANSINTLISNLFAGRGRCYVMDGLDMTLEYRFEFWLEPYEYVIITGGVAPRPAGVLLKVFQVDVLTTFGFQENVSLQPFDQGTFFN